MLVSSASAARSAHTDRRPLRNPVPRSTKFPASANLRSWLWRIPAGSAAHPDLRCERSTARPARPYAAPQSKTCAHGPDAAARWARAPAARDTVLNWSLTPLIPAESLLCRAPRCRRKRYLLGSDLQHRFSADMHETQFPRGQQRVDRFLHLGAGNEI